MSEPPRTIAFAAVLTAVFAVLFTGFELNRNYGMQVCVDMVSSVSSTAQLFFDKGRGFNQEDSIFFQIAGSDQPRRLEFNLPFARYRAFRFDPAMTAGVFTLSRVGLRHRNGKEMLVLPAKALLALNQIAMRQEGPKGVTFTTIPVSDDPSILFQLAKPLGFLAGFPSPLITTILLGDLLIGLCGFVVFKTRRTVAHFIESINSRLVCMAQALSIEGFIQFDLLCLWFYIACLTLFIGASGANLNGSSIEEYKVYLREGTISEILGVPRGIRSDEWAFHTPAILNQAYREQPLSIVTSSVGSHSVSLLANIPVRHYSEIFRPQFWAFFVLPPSYAFSVYWQCKALFVLTGVFTFSLWLSGSSMWALIGSLWFFFSPHMQWTYSSPNLLPEMVGALCFSVFCFCLLIAARTYTQIIVGLIGAVMFSLNFALCAYVPGLVPLIWVGVSAALGWLYQSRKMVFSTSFRNPRLLGILVCLVIVGATLSGVMHEAQTAVQAISNTVHPGKRVFAGGYFPIQYEFSDFFALSETEDHVPPALINICEASGFFWFAPAILFFLRRRTARLSILICLFASFFLLLAWSILPIPSYIGRLFALDRTWASRCMPALGLANIAIVTIFMTWRSSRPRKSKGTGETVSAIFFLGGTVVVVLCSLLLVNQIYGNYFALHSVLLATSFTSVLIFSLREGYGSFFASLIIVSHVFVWGLINPVEKGIGAVTSSSLFQFVRSHPGLLRGRWLVFSPSFAAPGFVKATGCDVYNGEQYQPDTDHFGLFASSGLDLQTMNRLGYLLAEPLFDHEKTSVHLEPNAVLMEWKVSPADPLLRQLGIRYFAFEEKPPDIAESYLRPLVAHSLDGFWLYEKR